MRLLFTSLLVLVGLAPVNAQVGNSSRPTHGVFWVVFWDCQGMPYLQPVWLPVASVYAPPPRAKADIREQANLAESPTPSGTNYPRIRPPQLPTEDPESHRQIPKSKPTPQENLKELPAPKPMVNVDQFMIPTDKPKGDASQEIKLGIFNHSDQAVDLEINGETLKLPADQYVTLRLPRSFTWSIRGQKSRSVNVPTEADGIEIVFRR